MKFLKKIIDFLLIQALSFSIIVVILVLIKIRTTKNNVDSVKLPLKKKVNFVIFRKFLMKIRFFHQSKGQVDLVFFKRVWKLIKIVIPSWKCVETLNLLNLTVFLVVRTFLSIYIANVNGRIVKAIINANYEDFIKKV